MKKIILSLAFIVATGAVITGVTMSYFSDTETSEDNTFAAGTMDLRINGGDVAVTTMTLANKAPGDAGAEAGITLNNAGSLDGELDVAMGTVTNYPCTDATYGRNDGTEFCLSDAGALGANAEMALYIDVDEDGAWTAGDIGLKSDETEYVSDGVIALDYDTMNNYSGKFWDDVYAGEMATGDEDGFVIDWQVPTTAGNGIQGDALEFDITFILEQADQD